MPMFHNSGRSAFNYALVCGARFVMRDRFSATAFWDDVRATDCRVAALIGPMTALIYSAPPSPDDARQPAPRRDPRADDPRDRRLRAPLRRAHGDVLRPDRGGHSDRHRMGPRPVGELRAPADGLPVAARCGWSTSTTSRSAPARWASWSCAAPEPWALNVGYYKMPEQTVEAWRNGWFHTGDAFRVRRRRLVLLRRPAARHDPPPRREHLVVRGRDVRDRTRRRARVRGDRGARRRTARTT